MVAERARWGSEEADPHDAARSEQFRHPAQRARAGMADEANRLTGLHGDGQAAEVGKCTRGVAIRVCTE